MNLSHENVTWLYVGAFAEELARAGVKHVCLCPGSRSTPLAMTFADNPKFKLWMHLDERSCAFFALGLAKASREPVVLVCTSGTAAANFFPAIAEAHQAHVPLIVLTADRPPELRETGAPQTIDQIKLYGDYTKWFAEMAMPEANVEMLRYVRTMACRAVATAQETPAGVVHFNMPFREPLVPMAMELTVSDAEHDAYFGRTGGKPFVSITRGTVTPDDAAMNVLAAELEQAERGLIVVGMQNDCALPQALTVLAEKLGYPILADPISEVRSGKHARANVIDAYDAFLRDASVAQRMAPEVVLRFGAIPTSKPVLQYLQRHANARQIVVDAGGWNEPAQIASDMVRGDAALVCEALTQKVKGARKDSEWLTLWRETNEKTKRAVTAQIATYEEPFEGRVFTELGELLPDGATLFVSSSMPVRDLDTFLSASDKDVRFLANRGANGIDGVVSTALGAGAASGGPLVLVIGDLAFYHDMNGLLAAKLHKLNATVVLVNNEGGGIFSFLPQAAHPAHFEQLFGTPSGLEFEHTAKLYDATWCDARAWGEFRRAVKDGLVSEGLNIVQVRTDRAKNVVMHRGIWGAVSSALELPSD